MSIASISNQLIQYHDENIILQNKINTLRDDIDSLSLKFSELNAITHSNIIAQLAIETDKAVLNLIFPEAIRKPYCINSLKNLTSFINNPNSDEFTSSLGIIAWKQLSLESKKLIKTRLFELIQKRPYLKVSIEILKDCAWRYHKQCKYMTVAEVVKFYKKEDDEVAADAVVECLDFLQNLSIYST